LVAPALERTAVMKKFPHSLKLPRPSVVAGKEDQAFVIRRHGS
jgi:hypothetical protein